MIVSNAKAVCVSKSQKYLHITKKERGGFQKYFLWIYNSNLMSCLFKHPAVQQVPEGTQSLSMSPDDQAWKSQLPFKLQYYGNRIEIMWD